MYRFDRRREDESFKYELNCIRGNNNKPTIKKNHDINRLKTTKDYCIVCIHCFWLQEKSKPAFLFMSSQFTHLVSCIHALHTHKHTEHISVMRHTTVCFINSLGHVVYLCLCLSSFAYLIWLRDIMNCRILFRISFSFCASLLSVGVIVN